MITIDQFAEVDLRTARVLSAEPHPNADRLLVLKVQLAEEERQIVAGIRDHYTPEQLVGTTVIVVSNLEPVTLRGVESRGMLLAVRDGERVVVLTTADTTGTGLRVS